MTTRDASQQSTAAARRPQAAEPTGPARRFLPALPTTERQRVRWFVAGHVLAVWLVFQLALAFGEGHAPAPFPPDLSPAERARAMALPAEPLPRGSQDATQAQRASDPSPAQPAAEWSRPMEWSR